MPLIVTSCYGEDHWRGARGWVDHIRAVADLPIEILSLDGGEYHAHHVTTAFLSRRETLSDSADTQRLRDSERLRHIVNRLKSGYTCLQVDMDVRLKRDLQPLIELPFDLVISRAFGMPKRVVQKLGFVGCMGFFIAKPGALPLLADLLAELETRGTNDQAVINSWFLESDWQARQVSIGSFAGSINYCELRSVQVCILPTKAITRNDDLDSSWFGNHWGTLGPGSFTQLPVE